MIKCVIPHYYKKFSCTAEKCIHNCCKGGWLIELTEDMIKKYEQMEGEIGQRIQKSVMPDGEGGYVFRLEDGVCPHLDSNGLCRIYQELGTEYMGTVCREFPRFSYIFADCVEAGIGLACEEAARIILSEGRPFAVEEIELSEAGLLLREDGSSLEQEEGYLEFLQKARTHIMRILWEGEGTVWDKIRRILDFSQRLQRHINCGNYDEVEDFTKETADIELSFEWDEDLSRETKKLLIDIYKNLEQLNEEWMDRADGIEESLLKDTYKSALEESEEGERQQLQLLSYFLYRYFMKSAEDYNVSDKLRLCVCNFVMLMAQFAAAKESKSDGKLSVEELVLETIVFSRQVEYSDSNVEMLFEEFNFGDELSESRIKLMLFK